VNEAGLPGELTADLFTQGIGVLGDLAAYLLAPGVELLRQTLLPGMQSRLHIPPCRLLGPEGEDAQERRGQRGLLALRKPRLT
jgi:hypothetical protein